MNLQQHEQNKSVKELWIVEGLKSLVLVENNVMPLYVCFPAFFSTRHETGEIGMCRELLIYVLFYWNVMCKFWYDRIATCLVKEKNDILIKQRNAPKLYFSLVLVSSKSCYRRLFASKFFPEQRSSDFHSNRGASDWKHPQHVKQQSEGNYELSYMGEVLAQTACLSGCMHPKAKCLDDSGGVFQ